MPRPPPSCAARVAAQSRSSGRNSTGRNSVDRRSQELSELSGDETIKDPDDDQEEPPKKRLSVTGRLNDWIGSEFRRNDSCKSFPFLLTFWVIFVATQWGHREIDIAYQLQSVLLEGFGGERIPHAMNKSAVVKMDMTNMGPHATQIRTWGDCISWMEMSVVPFVWGKEEGHRGKVLVSNRVLGGIRIQSFRLAEEDCPGPENLVSFYNEQCYSSSGVIDTSEPASHLAHLQGEAVDDQGSRIYWLDLTQPIDDVKEHLEALRRRQWLADWTREARVQIVMYNGREAVFVLITGIFSMSSGGAMTPKLTLKTLPAVIYKNRLLMAGDCLLMILLGWLFLGEIAVCVRAKRKRKCKELRSPYRVANWAIIIVGGGYCTFFGYLSTRLGAITDRIPELIDETPPTALRVDEAYAGTAWEARHSLMNESYDEMAHLAELLRYAELGTFWYCMLILLKFMQAFEGSPRLAVITETLREAMSDIIHFGIILAFVFVNFSVGACFLFGHQLKAWSSMQYATNSSFRALMGDFDFMAMSAIAPVSATVWFWLFMVLIYLIMINMFLAIVMDAYMKVKEGSRDRPALWEEFVTNIGQKMMKTNSKMLPRAVTMMAEKQVLSIAEKQARRNSFSSEASDDNAVRSERNDNGLMNSETLQELLSELKSLGRRMSDLEGSVRQVQASPGPQKRQPAHAVAAHMSHYAASNPRDRSASPRPNMADNSAGYGDLNGFHSERSHNGQVMLQQHAITLHPSSVQTGSQAGVRSPSPSQLQVIHPFPPPSSSNSSRGASAVAPHTPNDSRPMRQALQPQHWNTAPPLLKR